MKRLVHLTLVVCMFYTPVMAVQASGVGDAVEDVVDSVGDVIDTVGDAFSTGLGWFDDQANKFVDLLETGYGYVVTGVNVIGGFSKNFVQALCNDTICGLFDDDSHSEYFGSWTVKALKLQGRVDKYAPLNKAVMPHTHNSFNSEAYMTIISYLDPNHKISVLNQLNIGIRALEYDVHWFNNDVTLCHNGGNGICSTGDRSLAEGLEEIKLWFTVAEHKANDVILMTLEDHLDGHYADAVADIEAQIGDLVYKPTNACDTFESILNVSKAQVLAAGKNIILINSSSSSCTQGGYGNYVFKGNWTGTLDETKIIGYPTCTAGDKDISTIQSGYYRAYADGTLLGQFVGELMTLAQVEALVSCGVNAVGPEPLDYYHEQHEAQIWSWSINEPNDANSNEDCAEQWSNSRFNDIDCSKSRRYACQNPDSRDWKITSASGVWSGGFEACVNEFGDDGYFFAVPANGYENNTLNDWRIAYSLDRIWVAYSDLKTEGEWLPERYFRIKGVQSGKCVDVSGASTSNGAQVHIWGCHSGDNQKWVWRTDGTIRSAMDENKCLDIDGGSTSNGANLQLWTCHGGLNQQWYWDGNSIKSKLHDKPFDVSGYGTDNGSNIHLWDYHGGDNQKWNLVN